MQNFQFITVITLLFCSICTCSFAQSLPLGNTTPGSREKPIEVSTGLYLMHIIKIDQPNQILSGLFEITMLWKDKSLAFQNADNTPKTYSGSDTDQILTTIWNPDPEIVNQADRPSIQKSNLAIFPDGSVKYRYIFSVDILTEFDYTRFPFDDQDLRIELQSFTYNSDQLVFVPSEQYTGISSFYRSDDWISFPMSVYTGLKRAFGFETQDRAYILYEMKLERRSQFYTLQIIIPFCFFILMATCVFWIYWVSVDRRVAVAATFMLTSVAFNFLVLNYLPSVPYKTMLNTIITSGYFMGGVIIAAVITFELFKESGRERIWVLGNKISRFVAPIVIITVWILIYYIFMNKDLQVVNLIR